MPPSDASPPGSAGRRVDTVTAVLEEAAVAGLSHDELVTRLLPVVYDELRDIARAQRRRYDLDGFQTTALVHEAYLRLAGHDLVPDRAYVFAAAARAMRNVLVDHARRRKAIKRGGGTPPTSLTGVAEEAPVLDDLAERVLDVDAALERLARLDERAAAVVECRYFGGLSVEATAAALGTSKATAKRDWRRARAWLRRELGGPDDPSGTETAEEETPPPDSHAA